MRARNSKHCLSTFSSSPMMVLQVSLVIAFSGLLLASAAAFAAYYYKLRRSKHIEVASDVQKKRSGDVVAAQDLKKEKSSLDVVRRYRWEEIRVLTSGFLSEVVGEGGFSTVYLATLPEFSTLAAVKVHKESERLYHAFKQEVEVLLHVRHDNIVRLLGYCDEEEQGALVFEYVPNGTLHEKLHGGGRRSMVVLPWAQRMCIAYKLARAVNYLHESCDLPIIHNDIKPSNVLLDDDLNCKLCDFGSAKMGFSATVRSSSTSTSSRKHGPMVGSLGYVDPHYLHTGIVSKKSDVYSYGVVVLELMTGVVAFCSETEQMLTAVMAPMLGNIAKLKDIMDPMLDGDFNNEEAVTMASLAASCVVDQPSLRPSMVEIIHVIEEKASTSITTVQQKDKGGEKSS